MPPSDIVARLRALRGQGRSGQSVRPTPRLVQPGPFSELALSLGFSFGGTGLSNILILYLSVQIFLSPGWKALQKSVLLLLSLFFKNVLSDGDFQVPERLWSWPPAEGADLVCGVPVG